MSLGDILVWPPRRLCQESHSHSEKYLHEPNERKPVILVKGELLEVQWGDINWADGFLMLRRARVRGQVTTPKNHQKRGLIYPASSARNCGYGADVSARPG